MNSEQRERESNTTLPLARIARAIFTPKGPLGPERQVDQRLSFQVYQRLSFNVYICLCQNVSIYVVNDIRYRKHHRTLNHDNPQMVR